jgi:pyruvate formate lyase activating enzyme
MVDGYGVRTTVFLKGCPLKCVWCCNIEGQTEQSELKVTAADCNACGRCVPLCPKRAIELLPEDSGGGLRVNREICDNCGKCVEFCYTGALSCFGKLYTVKQLMKILERDSDYYRSFNGGVTIGGGEPTMHAEFTRDLIDACHKKYIHVALDTCGYTLSNAGFSCLTSADLLLFDLKHTNSKRHKELTGVPNEPILDNLRKLDDLGQHIIVRIPFIPGLNDSEENLRSSAKLLAGLKSLERLDLIGYHNYSLSKYEQLGKPYSLTMPAADERYMGKILDLFAGYGINAQLGG